MDKSVKSELHGCIVCGKLYQLLVVYGADGSFLDAKLMAAGAMLVEHQTRPLTACLIHSDESVERAVQRVYEKPTDEEDF